MKIALVVCLHGNEQYGLEVAEQSTLDSFVGNPQAVKEGVRFIDEDMNRCFPGAVDGSIEQRRAHELLQEIEGYDAVIDLHSTSNDCPLFGLVTSLDDEILELAYILHLRRLVYFPKKLRTTTALIDVKPGISLELGPHDGQIVEDVVGVLDNLDAQPGVPPIVFEVTGIIKQEQPEVCIENFQQVQKGQVIAKGDGLQKAQQDFVAILVDEDAYEGVLCLVAKKVSL